MSLSFDDTAALIFGRLNAQLEARGVTRDFVGWVKLSVQPNEQFISVGFRTSTQPTFFKTIYLAINEKWYHHKRFRFC